MGIVVRRNHLAKNQIWDQIDYFLNPDETEHA